MQFLFVYIREAGAGRSAGEEPALDGEAPRDPETHLERVRIANSFANEVQLSLPCVVDGMGDAAMQAYAAHPARLYLVGRDGRIAFAGRPASVALDPGTLDAALSAVSGNVEAAPESANEVARRHREEHDALDKARKLAESLVGRLGIEPRTNGLKARCSAS